MTTILPTTAKEWAELAKKRVMGWEIGMGDDWFMGAYYTSENAHEDDRLNYG